MRNLKLSAELSLDLQLQFEGETLLISAFDIEHNRAFFASSANLLYSLQLPSSQKGRPWSQFRASSEAELITLEAGDSIVAMDYLMEKEALVLGTADGSLVLHVVDSRTTEVVGKVDGGVKSIVSSPDGALLAVTSGLGQLLVMTHDWEVLYETELDPQPSEYVAIGDANINYSSNLFQSSVAWRGDGKYFATLCGYCNSSLKTLSIWERESGILHSTMQPKAFMGLSLDWMPSGAKVVAAYDRKAEQKSPLIVFVEKNGLERSSLTLDEPVEAAVENLKWNCNSDLLAAKVTYNGYDAVKIWSCSNNHWYLKQEIRYSKKDGVNLFWDPIKPLHLICWTLSGQILSYNFVWVSAVTETSIVLTIDNCSIRVSSLALSLMPPPLSLFKLNFPCAIRDIAFYSKSTKNHLAVFLSDGSLCVVELPGADMWEQFEGREFAIETAASDLTFGTFMHLTWLDSHILLGVSCCHVESSTISIEKKKLDHQYLSHSHNYVLNEIQVVCSESSLPDLVNSSGWHAKVSKNSSLEGPIIGVVPSPAKRCSAFIQMDTGSIFEYSSNLITTSLPTESSLRNFSSDCGFTISCPWMRAILVCDNGIMKSLVFGLDDNGRLQLGKRLLCSTCTSFSFYSNTSGASEQVMSHLLFTTKQDLLFIIRVDDILHGNPELDIERYSSGRNKGEENSYFLNIWERGSKLVGIIHGDEAAVVLQAPRGNLECIYPRKLVLVSIVNALVQRRFKDAMLMVRRHRIDFNIIVDYCGWQAFLGSAKDFVVQVDNLGHITDFVCAMKNENVMDTLYKNHGPLSCLIGANANFEKSEDFGSKSKVSTVLQAVRKALEEQVQESPARELCILTTLAQYEPPALEEALKRIKVIREMEILGLDDARRKTYPSAEESLKHLLWLTDPEAVFEAALGLYDLNLAAIVALNSQKDPKEFIPFLRELEQLEPVIMKYTIDLRLRRYDSALKHIVSAGDDYYEDCMNLMKNYPELFPLGHELLTDPIKRKHVLEAWGDYLQGEKCFEDAATTYLCCSSFQKALKAYRACGDWKGVFTVGALLNLRNEEVLQLANELCEEFQALGKPAEAAKVALDYCSDVARGVGYFIMAREWEEALRIGYMHGRKDLVSDVTNSTLDCSSTLLSEFKEGCEKVGKYLARYLAVRQRRLVLAAKIQSEDRLVNNADYDTVSEVSSNFSGMSAYTMRTVKDSGASISSSTSGKARQMRNQRKKGGKIRAGSPGEEMALVEHLKSMSLTSSAQSELRSLLRVLVTLGKEETARQLHRAADTFELSQQAAVKLAEDTIASDVIDESTQTLEHYMKKIRESHLNSMSWQSKVLLPP